jgi:hypothetical protein
LALYLASWVEGARTGASWAAYGAYGASWARTGRRKSCFRDLGSGQVWGHVGHRHWSGRSCHERSRQGSPAGAGVHVKHTRAADMCVVICNRVVLSTEVWWPRWPWPTSRRLHARAPHVKHVGAAQAAVGIAHQANAWSYATLEKNLRQLRVWAGQQGRHRSPCCVRAFVKRAHCCNTSMMLRQLT